MCSFGRANAGKKFLVLQKVYFVGTSKNVIQSFVQLFVEPILHFSGHAQCPFIKNPWDLQQVLTE